MKIIVIIKIYFLLFLASEAWGQRETFVESELTLMVRMAKRNKTTAMHYNNCSVCLLDRPVISIEALYVVLMSNRIRVFELIHT